MEKLHGKYVLLLPMKQQIASSLFENDTVWRLKVVEFYGYICTCTYSVGEKPIFCFASNRYSYEKVVKIDKCELPTY